MRMPPRLCLHVLPLLIAAAWTLTAEPLYLGRFAEAGETLRLNDLLAREAEEADLGNRTVPLAVGGGAVYLTSRGLSDLVGLEGADFVGSGVWIYSSRSLSDEAAVRLLLSRVSAAVGEIGSGLRLEEGEFARLFDGDTFSGDLRVQSRNGGLRLYGRAGAASSISMSYLESGAPSVERVPAGSMVSVRIYRGGLTVEVSGRTNRSANVGERVQVTLGTTRRSMQALLTGLREAEVRL